MSRASTAERTNPPSALRVLSIDYGVGFGGATKSNALVLRHMDHVRFRVLTSQDPDIRETWYSKVPVRGFRRWISYHTKWQLGEWLGRRAATARLRPPVMKLFALVDVATSLWHTVAIAAIVLLRRIDVIHLVNGYVPAEGLWASRVTRVPCVVNLRGFWSGPDRLLPPSTRHNAYLVGDSKAVTDSVPEWWCAPDRRRTIYETVDVRAFDATRATREPTRSEHGLKAQDIVFAIMGRVVPWKGQLEFTRAMVLAMREDARIRAMIVGDGPDPYMKQIRDTIRGSGLASRFILPGYTAAVEPYYAAADVVVHASIEPEPCGMVVMEGMAARRPVIAADAGGPTELITPGEDGLLVPPGDVPALAEAILTLARDSDRRSSMGENGYRKARTRFDVPVIAEAVRELYAEVAGK